MLEIKGKYATAYIMIDDVESKALNQIYNMTNHIITKDQKIVIMCDVHAGASNAVIGFTMPLTEKIISNIVGVDIGCGMLGFNIGQNVVSDNKDELLLLDEKIRKTIPFGNQIQNKSAVPSHYFEKNYPWDEANDVVKKFCVAYNNKFGTDYKPITYTYDWFVAKQKEIKMKQNAELGIGTLGGGELIASMWVNSLQ